MMVVRGPRKVLWAKEYKQEWKRLTWRGKVLRRPDFRTGMFDWGYTMGDLEYWAKKII